MVEMLSFSLVMFGFLCLFMGFFQEAYDGLKSAIPWWIAWFILHGAFAIIEIIRLT